jgi:hypothetical protein
MKQYDKVCHFVIFGMKLINFCIPPKWLVFLPSPVTLCSVVTEPQGSGLIRYDLIHPLMRSALHDPVTCP